MAPPLLGWSRNGPQSVGSGAETCGCRSRQALRPTVGGRGGVVADQTGPQGKQARRYGLPHPVGQPAGPVLVPAGWRQSERRSLFSDRAFLGVCFCLERFTTGLLGEGKRERERMAAVS